MKFVLYVSMYQVFSHLTATALSCHNRYIREALKEVCGPLSNVLTSAVWILQVQDRKSHLGGLYECNFAFPVDALGALLRPGSATVYDGMDAY